MIVAASVPRLALFLLQHNLLSPVLAGSLSSLSVQQVAAFSYFRASHRLVQDDPAVDSFARRRQHDVFCTCTSNKGTSAGRLHRPSASTFVSSSSTTSLFMSSSTTSDRITSSHDDGGVSAAASTPPFTNKNPNDTMVEGNGDDDAQFAQFRIPAASIFYRSQWSVSFVNLRPIVPGHVLVMPKRRVPLLRDLTMDEYDDLWRTVRSTQHILSSAYPNCTAFNVAVQDGPGAGQSVPHVHVHVLPRSTGDFARNDDIYEALEEWAPRPRSQQPQQQEQQRRLVVQEDDQRRDRTADEMAQEAATYRSLAAAAADAAASDAQTQSPHNL